MQDGNIMDRLKGHSTQPVSTDMLKGWLDDISKKFEENMLRAVNELAKQYGANTAAYQSALEKLQAEGRQQMRDAQAKAFGDFFDKNQAFWEKQSTDMAMAGISGMPKYAKSKWAGPVWDGAAKSILATGGVLAVASMASGPQQLPPSPRPSAPLIQEPETSSTRGKASARLDAESRLERMEAETVFDRRRLLLEHEYDIIEALLKKEHASREDFARLRAALQAREHDIDDQESAAALHKKESAERASITRLRSDQKTAADAEFQMELLNARTAFDRKRANADIQFSRELADLRRMGATVDQFEAATAAHKSALEAIDVAEKKANADKQLNEDIQRTKTLHGIELEGARSAYEYRRMLAKATYENSLLELKKEGIDTPENRKKAEDAYSTKLGRIDQDEVTEDATKGVKGLRQITGALGELAKLSGNNGLSKIFQAVNQIGRFLSGFLKMGATGGLGGFLSAIGGILGFDEGGYTGAGARYAPAGIVHRGEIVFEKSLVDRYGSELMQLRSAMQGGRGLADVVRNSTTVLAQPAPVVNVVLVGSMDGQKFLRKNYPEYQRFQGKEKK